MTTKDTKVQVPRDVNFDIKEPHQRIRYIRKKTGKYNEATRDFLDELKLTHDHLVYIEYNSPLLSLICSGPKGAEWEQRLRDATDYLNNLETFPAIEDELVKVSNNLEEISTEIHLVWFLKNRPLEPIDIYEALHIHQGVHIFQGKIEDAWVVAPPEAKEYCERLANQLRGMSEIPKPKREKGMGQAFEPEPREIGKQPAQEPQVLPGQQPTGQPFFQQQGQQPLGTLPAQVQQAGPTEEQKLPVIIAHEETITIETTQMPTQPGYFQQRPV